MRTNRFDFGIVLAGDVDITLGSWRLTVEARYTHGSADLTSLFPFITLHNRVLSLLVGTRFRVFS